MNRKIIITFTIICISMTCTNTMAANLWPSDFEWIYPQQLTVGSEYQFKWTFNVSFNVELYSLESFDYEFDLRLYLSVDQIFNSEDYLFYESIRSALPYGSGQIFQTITSLTGPESLPKTGTYYIFLEFFPYSDDSDLSDNTIMSPNPIQVVGEEIFTEDISDYISSIDIEQTWDYGDPTDSEDLMFELYFGIFAHNDDAINMDTDVNSLELLTPKGHTFQIPKQTGRLSDGFCISYEYEEEYNNFLDMWFRDARWECRARFTDIADLQAFGDGEYTVTLHYNNGSRSQTKAWFGMMDTQVPIPQPIHEPVLTFPLHNQTLESPVMFTWEQCNDANAAHIYIEMEEYRINKNAYAAEGFDVNETSWGPIALTDGIWKMNLIFEQWTWAYSNDGISINQAKNSQSTYEFTITEGTPLTTFEVWGGNMFLNDYRFTNIEENGYEMLGQSDGQTATFSGKYGYYFIGTRGEFLLDSIMGSDNTYYSSFEANCSRGNTSNDENLLGPPDGNCATVGGVNLWSPHEFDGYIVFTNPGDWEGLTVITRNLDVSKSVSNSTDDLKNVSPGDMVTYMISFDSNDLTVDVNNVTIIDYLPNEVSYISADTNEVFGFYDVNEHTFTWSIPAFSWGSTINLPLTVEVNMGVAPDTIITNFVTIDSNETPAAVASEPVTVSKNLQREAVMQINPPTISRHGIDVSGVMVILELPSDISEEQVLKNELLVLSLDSESSDVTVIANADQSVTTYEGITYVLAVFDKTQLLNAIPGYGQKKIKVEGKLIEGSFIGTGILTIN